MPVLEEDVDKLSGISKSFQVNITIFRARHLRVANATVAVDVIVGNHFKVAKAKTKKSDRPYFNRFLSFSFVESIETFLKKQVKLRVRKKSHFACKQTVIGEVDMEMGMIWKNRHHRLTKHWFVLTKPLDPKAVITGFLLCNIEILLEAFHFAPSASSSSVGEEVQLTDVKQLRGLFTLDVYRGDGFNSYLGDFYENMYVKLVFAGNSVRSKVMENTSRPEWNESLSIIAMLPPLYENMDIEVWDEKKNCLVGNTRIIISEFEFDEKRDIYPCVGPTFLYLYRKTIRRKYAPKFMGRILVSLNTRLLEKSFVSPTTTVNITPIKEMFLPPYTNYILCIAVFNIIFLQPLFTEQEVILRLGHGSGTCGPKLPLREEHLRVIRHHSDNKELGRTVKLADEYSFLDFSNGLICLQVASEWPKLDIQEGYFNFIESQSVKLGEIMTAYSTAISLHKNRNETFLCKQFLKINEKIIDNTLDKQTEEVKKLTGRNYWLIISDLLLAIKRRISILFLKDLLSLKVTMSVGYDLKEVLSRHLEHSCAAYPDIELTLTNRKGRRELSRSVRASPYLKNENKEYCGFQYGKRNMILFRDSSGAASATVEACLFFASGKRFVHCPVHPSQKGTPEHLNFNCITTMKKSFNLRVYVYQARLNAGADVTGLADPYTRILMPGLSKVTKSQFQTLQPFWDETVHFKDITVVGDRNFIKKESINIIVEVMDFDRPNKSELVGRCILKPEAKFADEKYIPPRLKWEKIFNIGEETGQILIATDFIEATGDRKYETTFLDVPDNIRPHYLPYRMEIIFWGVRNFHSHSIMYGTRALLKVECAGISSESVAINTDTIINFPHQIQFNNMLIPREPEYSPPITVSLLELSSSGKTVFKGGYLLDYINKFIEEARPIKPIHFGYEKKSNDEFTCNKLLIKLKSIFSCFNAKPPEGEIDETADWWTKYYSTKHREDSRGIFYFYNEELEKQPEFSGFRDFLNVMPLTVGKSDIRKSRRNIKEAARAKFALRIHPVHNEILRRGFFNNYPHNIPLDIVVRVYIVAGMKLSSTTTIYPGKFYISATLGKQTKNNRKDYVYGDENPIFGTCIEFRGKLPTDHTLIVKVMDHSVTHVDTLVGLTKIDIENRYYTKHRASCGIQNTFEKTGFCQWRDIRDPTEILSGMCKMFQVPLPWYGDNYIKVGSTVMKRNLAESDNEVALRILKCFPEMPEFGFPLVPEHVETRCLFHPKKGQIEQGKLEMWVDIFPLRYGVPHPANIKPRDPIPMELRVIVWSICKVPVLHGLFTTAADLSVKAWITSKDDAQITDIHHKSMTGEGVFNWRMVFPFEYFPALRKIIVRKRDSVLGENLIEKIPCELHLQILDNDLLYAGFVGDLSLTLWNMPKGARFARTCSLEKFERSTNRVNLFNRKMIRGWWPFRGIDNEKNKDKSAGKIDLQLEIVSAENARNDPVGLGRQPPNPLPIPLRVNVNSSWLFGSLVFHIKVLFANLVQKLIIILVLAAVILFFLIGIYSVPGIMMGKWLGAERPHRPPAPFHLFKR